MAQQNVAPQEQGEMSSVWMADVKRRLQQDATDNYAKKKSTPGFRYHGLVNTIVHVIQAKPTWEEDVALPLPDVVSHRCRTVEVPPDALSYLPTGIDYSLYDAEEPVPRPLVQLREKANKLKELIDRTEPETVEVTQDMVQMAFKAVRGELDRLINQWTPASVEDEMQKEMIRRFIVTHPDEAVSAATKATQDVRTHRYKQRRVKQGLLTHKHVQFCDVVGCGAIRMNFPLTPLHQSREDVIHTRTGHVGHLLAGPRDVRPLTPDEALPPLPPRFWEVAAYYKQNSNNANSNTTSTHFAHCLDLQKSVGSGTSLCVADPDVESLGRSASNTGDSSTSFADTLSHGKFASALREMMRQQNALFDEVYFVKEQGDEMAEIGQSDSVTTISSGGHSAKLGPLKGVPRQGAPLPTFHSTPIPSPSPSIHASPIHTNNNNRKSFKGRAFATSSTVPTPAELQILAQYKACMSEMTKSALLKRASLELSVSYMPSPKQRLSFSMQQKMPQQQSLREGTQQQPHDQLTMQEREEWRRLYEMVFADALKKSKKSQANEAMDDFEPTCVICWSQYSTRLDELKSPSLGHSTREKQKANAEHKRLLRSSSVATYALLHWRARHIHTCMEKQQALDNAFEERERASAALNRNPKQLAQLSKDAINEAIGWRLTRTNASRSPSPTSTTPPRLLTDKNNTEVTVPSPTITTHSLWTAPERRMLEQQAEWGGCQTFWTRLRQLLGDLLQHPATQEEAHYVQLLREILVKNRVVRRSHFFVWLRQCQEAYEDSPHDRSEGTLGEQAATNRRWYRLLTIVRLLCQISKTALEQWTRLPAQRVKGWRLPEDTTLEE